MLPTARAWLAAGNSELLDFWEQSLEELERDLMEIFPWWVFLYLIQKCMCGCEGVEGVEKEPLGYIYRRFTIISGPHFQKINLFFDFSS